MKLDTKADLPGRAGAAARVENAPQLFERLQAFGLIEANGKGGWQLTECCEVSLATLPRNTDTPPKAAAAVIRPWRPRTLV